MRLNIGLEDFVSGQDQTALKEQSHQDLHCLLQS